MNFLRLIDRLALFNKQPFHTGEKALEDDPLREAFRGFLSRDLSYRLSYKQTKYGFGFDGYSYPGQRDSVNQSYDDCLHSFVFSDSFPVQEYPDEFHEFLKVGFKEIKLLLWKEIENLFDEPTLIYLKKHYSFSVSANYYPAMSQLAFDQIPNHRLSAHMDGSLLTFFPFGLDHQLEMEWDGQWVDWPASQYIISFPGYLTELLTEGQTKGLTHRLKHDDSMDLERFSFAFFLVPNRGEQLAFMEHGQSISLSVEDYYKRYLSLFD